MDIQQIGAQFITGLMWGKLSVNDVIQAFDGNVECWQRFQEPDSAIIRYMLENGKVINIPKLQAFVGSEGAKRLDAVNQLTLDVDYTLSEAVLWAAYIESDWQQRQGLEIAKMTVTALQKPKGEVGTILLQSSAEMTAIATLRFKNQVGSAYEAGLEANQKLNSLVGIGGDRFLETDMENFNDEFGGIERGKITAVGGEAGSMKTALVSQWTTHLARQGRVVVWACEIPKADMLFRDAIRETGCVTMKQLRRLGRTVRPLLKQLRESEHEAQQRALETAIENESRLIVGDRAYQQIREKILELSELPIVYTFAGRLNAMTTLGVLRTAQAQYGRVDVLVVDHIQLFGSLANIAVDAPMGVRQRYIEMRQEITYHFPDVAMISIQHLNKEIQKVVKGIVVPQQTDFAYGGHQEMDAGFIIIRDKQYQRQLNLEEKIADLTVRIAQGDKTAEKELEKIERKARLWSVKVREGRANWGLSMQVQAEYFKWQEVSK